MKGLPNFKWLDKMKKIGFFFLVVCLTGTLVAQTPTLVIQKGHSKKIVSMAVSPLGNYIATGAKDHLVILTDMLTGSSFKTLAGHTDDVEKIKFTPDGKKLISSSKNEIIVWDVITEKKLFANKEGVSDNDYVLGITPDSKKVYFKGYGAAFFCLDLETREEIKVDLDRDAYDMLFTPDNKNMLLFLENEIAVLDPLTYEKKYILGTQNMPICYFLTRDGKYLYTANKFLVWQKWDLAKGKMLESKSGREDSNDEIKGFANVNADHTTVSVYSKGVLSFYDLWTGRLISSTNYEEKFEEKYGDKELEFTTASLSFDGKVFIGGISLEQNASEFEMQRLWYIDTHSGRTIRETKGYFNSVCTISISPDDKKLAIAGVREDGMPTRVWEMDRTGGQLIAMDRTTFDVRSIFWSPDSKVIVAGEQMMELGSKQSRETHQHFQCKFNEQITTAISNDFKYYVGYNNVCLFETGAPVCMIDVEKGSSHKLYSEKENGNLGRNVFMGHDNKTLFTYKKEIKSVYVNIYNVEECANKGIISHISKASIYSENKPAFAVGALNKHIAIGTNEVVVYDIASQDKLLEIAGVKKADEFMVSAMAMNKDENLLAVGYLDTSIVVYELPSGKAKCTLRGHDLPATSLVFKHKTDVLISGSPDAKIIFWDPQKGEELGTFMAVDTTDFIFTTPENYYYASKGALKNIVFRSGKRLYPYEQYDLKYNRPDKVFKRLDLASEKQLKMYHTAYQKRLKKSGYTEEQLANSTNVPMLEVAKKYELPLIKYDDTLNFKIKATDDIAGISRIHVYINDVAVYGQRGMVVAGNPKILEKTLSLKLSKGQNAITVSVTNAKGVESMRENFEVSCEKSVQPDLYVLLVGVSQYQEPGHNLTYAAKDAQDLAKLFNENETFGTKNIKVLSNSEATRENILKAATLFKTAKEDDVVIIYVSGHGLLDDKMDFYLATYDIGFSAPATKGLAYEELERIMDEVTARNRLILLDACHSGEVDKEDVEKVTNSFAQSNDVKITYKNSGAPIKPKLGLHDSFAYMQVLFDDVTKGTGTTVISAAAGTEFALESPEWKNGVFTYSILSAFSDERTDANQDNQISIAELKNYVARKVMTLTEGRQVPNARKENSANNFVLKVME